MSRGKFSITGQDTFGSEMKKYAKCTLISTFITLALATAVQILWFKYDAILREGWLRISYAGYTSEEEPWIRFFQSPLLEKFIPVCSLIVLGILLLYMTYDILRSVNSDSEESSLLKRFINKFAAIGIFSAISAVLLTVAGFLGNGCLSYNDGLYQLEERSFLPIGGYTYDQVWTKYPSVNVKTYVFAFLMVLYVCICLHLFSSLVSFLVDLSSKKVAIAAALMLLAIAVGLVYATGASVAIVLGLVVMLFIADVAFQIFAGSKLNKREQMA